MCLWLLEHDDHESNIVMPAVHIVARTRMSSVFAPRKRVSDTDNKKQNLYCILYYIILYILIITQKSTSFNSLNFSFAVSASGTRRVRRLKSADTRMRVSATMPVPV